MIDKFKVHDEYDLTYIIPKVSQGKEIYISGKGPSYLTVAMAEAYANTSSSVSVKQPGVGYICSISNDENKKLGDLTKNPIVKEEVKEQLVASKENLVKERDE